MKKINKDYISIVRNVNRRLQFERIPMQKSTKTLTMLYKMSEEDNYTVEDMEAYVRDLPVFKFLALPYYKTVDVMELDSPEDSVMQDLVNDLKASKTKARNFEKAVALIEECDYRWNIIRITNSLPDILICSHPGYDSTYLDLRLTKDMSIVFEATDLDAKFDGNLYYIVYKGNTPVLPYRSVVELYECSDDILDATKVFDPEPCQWDNALKSFTATVNAILDDEEAYMKANVIEAGQEMLEKIKLMCLDAESYYAWLVNISDNVAIEYSECAKSLDLLYEKDESDRRPYELYAIGRKMSCALLLADNLKDWSEQGLEFSRLADIKADLESIARSLLQEMEKEHDNLPEDERGEISRQLRRVCEELRGWLAMERRFPEGMNQYEPIM